MKELTTEKVMTVKEVAEAIGVSYDTVNNCIKRLFVDKIKNGKKTFLNELEVAKVSKELKSNKTVTDRLTFEVSTKVTNTTTKAELVLNYKLAMEQALKASEDLNKMLEQEVAILNYEKQGLQEQVTDKNETINRLVHTNKIYSATEIAKEIGFRSATALNNDLSQKGIQYKQNGTWVLYSNYSNLGYTEIKQTVLDNGTVVYNRMFTGSGRKWLLKMYDVQ